MRRRCRGRHRSKIRRMRARCGEGLVGPMREHRWVAVLYALVVVRAVERVVERSQLVARRGCAKVAIFLDEQILG